MLKPDMLELCLKFVWEREQVRIRKEAGQPAPWTDDPILQTYRFCNIRRRDDRMTKWLTENIYEPRKDWRDLWFVALACRLINWPPTIKILDAHHLFTEHAESFDAGFFSDMIEDAKTYIDKVYGGAYVVYPGREKINKSEFLAHRVLMDAVSKTPDIRTAVKSNSIESSITEIAKVFGVSTFIAGQAVADLTYFDEQLGTASDLYTFAPIGPGSQNGLNYLHGRKQGSKWKQEDFNAAVIELSDNVKSRLGITDLTLHDIQNSCGCEFFKYARTTLGDGKPKTKFKPEIAY